MAGVLDRINQPNDIKKIDASQYKKLAKEINDTFISINKQIEEKV